MFWPMSKCLDGCLNCIKTTKLFYLTSKTSLASIKRFWSMSNKSKILLFNVNMFGWCQNVWDNVQKNLKVSLFTVKMLFSTMFWSQSRIRVKLFIRGVRESRIKWACHQFLEFTLQNIKYLRSFIKKFRIFIKYSFKKIFVSISCLFL